MSDKESDPPEDKPGYYLRHFRDGDPIPDTWNGYEWTSGILSIGQTHCQPLHAEDDCATGDESWQDFAVRVCDSVMDTKRLCYRIVRGREFGLCPPCGPLPACLTCNTTVIKCNCTRDDVLKMIETFKE